MARAKSRKKPTTDVAKQHAHYPYLHVGHGTSRCSDALSIWLIFGDAPGGAERAVIEEAMPEALRNQARSKDGTLRWCGPVLFVNSGMDFKYFVAGYDPNYLAWLDTSKPLPEADVQRVQREVMNADLSGPKQPKRSAWDAFNADIELWLAKAAATQPLKLVVKDVAVRDADATPWHRASAERALAELDGLVALVRASHARAHRQERRTREGGCRRGGLGNEPVLPFESAGPERVAREARVGREGLRHRVEALP